MSSLLNRIKIIFCQSRKCWIIVDSEHGTVKIYDCIFCYLDRDSLTIIEKCFTCNGEVPQVKMVQCRKQEGTKDCGVYAIVFAVAVAMGCNPSRQNVKQDMIRAHLVRCF